MLTPEERRTWLDGLKEGDEVLMAWTPRGGHSDPQWRDHEIRRITKRHIVLNGNLYFRRSDGRRVPLYLYRDENWRLEAHANC